MATNYFLIKDFDDEQDRWLEQLTTFSRMYDLALFSSDALGNNHQYVLDDHFISYLNMTMAYLEFTETTSATVIFNTYDNQLNPTPTQHREGGASNYTEISDLAHDIWGYAGNQVINFSDRNIYAIHGSDETDLYTANESAAQKTWQPD